MLIFNDRLVQRGEVKSNGMDERDRWREAAEPLKFECSTGSGAGGNRFVGQTKFLDFAVQAIIPRTKL